MSVINFHSGATHSLSSTTLPVSKQEGSRNFRMYSLSYKRRQKRLKSKTKFMQYGVFYHTFTWNMEHWQLTIHSGFVSLRMYLAHYWNWNRCSSMTSVAGMVKSLRTSALFLVADQRQFQLWQFSQNLMISSHKSMIGKKETKRIEKLHMPPWRRNSESHLRVTIFHLVHMCDLNVCFFFFSHGSWDLQHFQLLMMMKVIIRNKLGN